jgi:peroxiredoxin
VIVANRLPDFALRATNGAWINLAQEKCRIICFFYPYTGRPDHVDPPGWDEIPGAHGSTPQALAFSKRCAEFGNLGVKIFGIGSQAPYWQDEFVSRNELTYPLLSDAEMKLADHLAVARFRAGEREFLKRTTFIFDDAKVICRRDDVDPHLDANQCLAWLLQ